METVSAHIGQCPPIGVQSATFSSPSAFLREIKERVCEERGEVIRRGEIKEREKACSDRKWREIRNRIKGRENVERERAREGEPVWLVFVLFFR